MAMKPRVLYLMQYLQDNSDELHPVTTAQIREVLAEKGCPVSIITLRLDIKSLIEAGYDIAINEQEGLSTTYSWLNRELSAPGAADPDRRGLLLPVPHEGEKHGPHQEAGGPGRPVLPEGAHATDPGLGAYQGSE